MPIAQRVGMDTSVCDISTRWTLDATLATMVISMRHEWHGVTPKNWRSPSFYIISGYRTPEHNAEVGGAPNSCHAQCPSRAVDLRMGGIEGVETPELWALLGGIWKLMGGRWGGDFGTGGLGINQREMNHFDIGPCL